MNAPKPRWEQQIFSAEHPPAPTQNRFVGATIGNIFARKLNQHSRKDTDVICCLRKGSPTRNKK